MFNVLAMSFNVRFFIKNQFMAKIMRNTQNENVFDFNC